MNLASELRPYRYLAHELFNPFCGLRRTFCAWTLAWGWSCQATIPYDV